MYRCGGTGGSAGQVCNADTGKVDHGLLAWGGAGLNGDQGTGYLELHIYRFLQVLLMAELGEHVRYPLWGL